MSALGKGLHLHFDPLSGIAGDMTVAALVDAGVPRRVVSDAVAAMGVRGLSVRFDRRKRGAYVGTGFTVSWPGGPAAPRARRTARAAPDEGHDHDHQGHDHDRDGHHHVRPSARPHRLILRAGHDHDHHQAHHAASRPAAAAPAAEHGHRDYAEIRRLLQRARLDADTRALAGEIFARVAEAEAELHGTPVDRIAFHEVGAYDSIADIVGAAAAISWLAPAAVSSSAPVLGTGSVRTAHGLVPVPAPATARLLREVPVRAEGEGELTTPTGAAILAVVVDRFGAAPPMRLRSQGFGAGTKELADRPNVLRVLMGEPLGQALPDSAPEVTLLATNIDDMSPQLVEPLLEALFAAGALDAWTTAITMKKGRPALEIAALAPAEKVPAVAEAFFRNSTTLGLRTLPMARQVLARSSARVATPYGPVSIKIAALEGAALGATPEFEDCRRLARQAGVPVRVVLAAASAAAARELDGAPARRRR
jgi:uncharacterized protein (TIGR00299 family) protein